MAFLTPEAIIRRVVSIYADDYSDSLSTVQTFWAATEDLVLDDFIDRVISANPEVLPKVWDTPLLQAGAGPIEQVSDSGLQQYHDLYEFDIQLFYYLRHSEARSLSLLIMRHMEATLEFLNRHPSLDYGDNNRIRQGSLSMTPSNTGAFGGGVLVKGLRVAFTFRFMSYGF